MKNMPFSTCCGAETDMEEIGICPECLEHCDFEEDEEELEADRQTENQIEEEQINKHQNK
jgi:hypothetical protein